MVLRPGTIQLMPAEFAQKTSGAGEQSEVGGAVFHDPAVASSLSQLRIQLEGRNQLMEPRRFVLECF